MEERLTVLPDPIRRVTIPETFSVSQIVAVDDCFLKVLIEMQGADVEQLPPNPSAELGKVFHSLLEKVVKGLSSGSRSHTMAVPNCIASAISPVTCITPPINAAWALISPRAIFCASSAFIVKTVCGVYGRSPSPSCRKKLSSLRRAVR